MNEKNKNAFSGKKARIVSITLCAVLILSAGTLTALAATNEGFLPFFNLSSAGGRGLSVRSDDNGTSYSADGGETWSDIAPENVTYTEVNGEDGESFSLFTTVDADDFDDGYFVDYLAKRPSLTLGQDDFEYLHMLRFENDTIYHSLDDGVTWIEGLPADMVREGADEADLWFEDEEGLVSFSYTVTIDD